MKRLIWLLGPPGAGKSTYATRFCHDVPRVVEINQMLFPLVKGTQINHGILTAIHSIVRLIKALELRPENIHEKSLLVVVGIAEKEVIFPLCEYEEVWLLLPPYDRWKLQFEKRPLDEERPGKYYENYSYYQYAEKWYHRFQDMQNEGLEIKKIETEFDVSLIGKLHYK